MSSEPVTQTPPLAVRVPEACRLSGIGRSKLYELIKAGELRTVKVGAITLIPLTSLERLLGLADRRSFIERDAEASSK